MVHGFQVLGRDGGIDAIGQPCASLRPFGQFERLKVGWFLGHPGMEGAIQEAPNVLGMH